MRRVVGIDPGLAGGLAIVDLYADGALARVVLHRTPTARVRHGRGFRREYDVAAMRVLIAGTIDGTAVPHVAIERQGARPGQGVVSTFRTGLGFGLWWGIVAGAALPYSLVIPGPWKRYFGLIGLDKPASRLRAQEQFPQLGVLRPVDEGCAEAALLALYVARRGFAPDVIGACG